MIARSHRFHGHASLRHVYQRGEVVRGPICSLKYLKNDKRQAYRLAVVVSKKVSKSAVVRNRIRRRIYETVRKHDPEIRGVYDIVVTVFHEQFADMPAKELETVVTAQLRQAGLLGK